LVELLLTVIVTGDSLSGAQDKLHAAFPAELEHHVSEDIDDPGIAVAVEGNGVNGLEESVSPRLQYISVPVELDNGALTAMDHPDAVVLVDGETRALAEVPAFGKLRPIGDEFMRQRRAGLQLRKGGKPGNDRKQANSAAHGKAPDEVVALCDARAAAVKPHLKSEVKVHTLAAIGVNS